MNRKNHLADVHIHSKFSWDSQSEIADICDYARQNNLTAVCITDHVDLKPEDNQMEILQKRFAIGDAVRRVRNQYPDLQVLLGVEIAGGGVFPKWAEEILKCDAVDQVIGSVHGLFFADGKEVSVPVDDYQGEIQYYSTWKVDYSQMCEEELIRLVYHYFDTALQMMKRTDMDIMAHLPYLFRYINGKCCRNLDWKQFLPKIETLLDYMISHGIALEINTSRFGSDYDDRPQYEEILGRYLKKGGYLITIGSDAHISERVGQHFDLTVDMLKRYGVQNLYYFKNRQPHPYPID